MNTPEISALIEEAERIGLYQQKQEIRQFMKFLQHYAKHYRLKNILEIGTQDGGSFYLWTHISEPDGIKITLDIPNGPYSTKPISEKGIAQRDAMIRLWGKNTHVFNEDSQKDTTIDKVADTLNGEGVDLLFIDGDHRFHEVMNDYVHYMPFVRKGGLIAFHDIATSDWHTQAGCFVSSVWNKIRYTHPVTYEFGPYENWGGIGVLQVGILDSEEEIKAFLEKLLEKEKK